MALYADGLIQWEGGAGQPVYFKQPDGSWKNVGAPEHGESASYVSRAVNDPQVAKVLALYSANPSFLNNEQQAFIAGGMGSLDSFGQGYRWGNQNLFDNKFDPQQAGYLLQTGFSKYLSPSDVSSGQQFNQEQSPAAQAARSGGGGLFGDLAPVLALASLAYGGYGMLSGLGEAAGGISAAEASAAMGSGVDAAGWTGALDSLGANAIPTYLNPLTEAYTGPASSFSLPSMSQASNAMRAINSIQSLMGGGGGTTMATGTTGTTTGGGTDWGNIANVIGNAISIAGGIQGLSSTSGMPSWSQMYNKSSSPWWNPNATVGAGPTAAAQRLQGLVSDPSSIYQDPLYTASAAQGQSELERVLAARGQTASGREMTALADYNRSKGLDFYNTQVGQLGALAGVNISPSSAVSAASTTAKDAATARRQAMGDIAAGVGGLGTNASTGTGNMNVLQQFQNLYNSLSGLGTTASSGLVDAPITNAQAGMGGPVEDYTSTAYDNISQYSGMYY